MLFRLRNLNLMIYLLFYEIWRRYDPFLHFLYVILHISHQELVLKFEQNQIWILKHREHIYTFLNHQNPCRNSPETAPLYCLWEAAPKFDGSRSCDMLNFCFGCNNWSFLLTITSSTLPLLSPILPAPQTCLNFEYSCSHSSSPSLPHL
jgi:hypothetical protein